jgi:hypothetical protein
MALTRITSGGIAEGVKIVFDSNNTPAAPAIRFNNSDDTGTGIYQPADNELAISTAGQPRLTFKADGTIITGNNTVLGGTNPNFEGAENITLYVNQADLNATDAEANDGGNLNRPFKTIERALLEAAKRSYKANPAPISVTALEVGKAYTITSVGNNTNFVSIGASSNTVGVSFIANAKGTGTGTVKLSNDKFEAFTIMVLPGQYEIDNRPGYDITTNPLVAGTATTINAEPFRFNPRNGGVIVPRGTSIVGYDLRKTVIRPKYVPAPFSTEGSLAGDGYALSHVMYDGANMIEKNRGYIQEQTKLYLESVQNPQSAAYNALSQAQKLLCVRDIGYFIDAICSDLRQGGNENTFNNAEYYIDGNGYRTQFMNSNDSDVSQEIAATVAAFNHAVQIMRSIVKSYNDGSTANAAPTYYSGGSIPSPTTFSVENGYSANGDCSSVVTAVATLGAIATGILNNPDDYTTEAVNVTLSNGTTTNIKLRKTQGVFKQTSIFKVTGGCYFWQMTFKDAVASDSTPIYNSATFDSNGIPTFTATNNAKYSHHKVVAFTYADQRTTDGELDQYYKKIDAWQGRTSDDPSQVRPEEFTIVGDGSKNTTIDTVNSCSPYIFNCSLRSVFGMCGMHTDGSKVAENSFKSMVVAQFTGISLQKDRSVFIQPKDLEGDSTDSDSTPTNPPIFADPDAEYKPECRHFHIKASNGGFIQVVSVFAVGYADQFLAETGGDMSITNSNSNFGQISLRAKGSQFNAFPPASQGRITAVIPPRGISPTLSSVSFYNIDADSTWKDVNGAVSDELTSAVQSQLVAYKNSKYFNLYLEISSGLTDDTIPELIVESKNEVTGLTERKRFLTFGTSNQYALFRDYYQASGISPESNRYINLELESAESTEPTKFKAKVKVFDTILDVDNPKTDGVPTTKNSERVGYFFDPTKRVIYLRLEFADAETNNFLENFIFAYNEEKSFDFKTDYASDGSAVTSLVQTTKKILKYKTGFPSTLIVKKYSDTRTATPGDLLWKVEYTIPKSLSSGVIPKAPEKRFIIKGTRAGNGEDGIPYSDYRFMVWDVEEVTAWEKNTRDGLYYLTVVRADVNKFVDSTTNVPSTITRRPTGITSTNDFDCTFVEQLNNFDKDTKLFTNINYLYPSVNEEGPDYDPFKIWNFPQSDSRVLIESIGSGNRIKDISVPNFKSYRGGTTPLKDIPSLYSVTAESVHRLVQSLDLRYISSSNSMMTSGGGPDNSGRVFVAPVVSWDSRTSSSSLGYTSSDSYTVYSTDIRFGRGSNTALLSGSITDDIPTITSNNKFGIDGDALDRRITVTSPGYTVNTTTLNDNSFSFAPVVPLYRPSILRASSHTWEYIGLGSGNYSTGFPNLQTRVLKIYEQFIAQGYENSGGFIASSGTNSAGDFYIGNQIIQAGGTSTVTLNVPKLRRSSESNYLDIANIENRISNAVINVTTTTGDKSNSNQTALKSLSNFFNIAKLTVSDKANINNLIIGQRLYIDRAEINNSTYFPEGNTNAYGFVKAAKPDKTGYISTDTNDKLYVSPKYLDAWRVKRQLISAQAVNLDNNRVYVQPYLQNAIDSYKTVGGKKVADAVKFTDTTVNDVTWSNTSVIKINFAESSGVPSYGKIDIQMRIDGLSVEDYYIDGSGNKVYFNPTINIPLQYESIDYTDNSAVLSNYQNGIPLITYLKSYCGTGVHTSILKNYPSIGNQQSTTTSESSDLYGFNASEGDIKYLTAKLQSNFTYAEINPLNTSTYKEIRVSMTADEYEQWPSRGCVSLRENAKGEAYKIATFAYYKIEYVSNESYATFKLVKNIGAATNANGTTATFYSTYVNNYPGISPKNVFFNGCSTLVYSSDRWASEDPFIPPLDPTKGVVEEVNIEDAILYKTAEKSIAVATNLDQEYFNKNLPNPYSSKALGVNIQERTAVKRFSPIFSFSQARQWAENSGFNSSDELELLMKPGYYKLDGTSFPCSVKINGTGVVESDVFAGKERTRTSAGRMGGYLEDSIKRGDSVYLYRSPEFSTQFGVGNDAMNVNVSGGLTTTGSFNVNNVHFLGLNEAISKSEIPDSIYSSDTQVQTARRNIRRAYYIKSNIKSSTDATGTLAAIGLNTINTSGIHGAIEVLANTTDPTSTVKAKLIPHINSTDVIDKIASNSTYLELNSATISNCRYLIVALKSSSFTATEFDKLKKYIIPGTTMYWLTEGGKVIKGSDEATVENLSKSTKVLSVRRKNAGLSTEELHILISVYRTEAGNNGNNGAYTNAVEDLDLDNYTTGNKKLVFLNEDGAEFTTLAYNWALETRRTFLPKGFMHEGGYQPAIIKTVTGLGTAGQKVITLNNVDSILTGDKIVALDSNGTNLIPIGTRIANISGNNITLTDNITTSLSVNSQVSFTQYDIFGQEIPKYDIPEIFGIIRGSEEGYISLIIDRNPNYEVDNTIKEYPYGSSSFGIYPTCLIQSKTVTGIATTNYGAPEDAAIAFNRKKSLPLRRNGYTEARYIVLDLAPREFGAIPSGNASDPNAATSIDAFIENAGIDKTILSLFANYDNTTLQFGGGIGTGFGATTVNFSNISIAAGGTFNNDTNAISDAISSALTNQGSLTNTRKYNGRLSAVLVSTGGTSSNVGIYANINTSTGAITSIRAYRINSSVATTINGQFTIQVNDGKGYILSPTGNTVSLSDRELSADDFKAVAKQNLLSAFSVTTTTGASGGASPYLDSVKKATTGVPAGIGVDDDALTARGKKVFLSWPYAYRALRRRFPSAGFPINGNYQSSLITVNALPGSDYTLNLTGVTIGAQSPASEAANTFGGGYRGGLIKCRGAKLTLNGTRFRGNLSLDWTGLFSGNSSRVGGSFIAGHSIEMFQMEDQNQLTQLGGTAPAYAIATSPFDEEFKILSEYNPTSNIYLEPSKDPYGELSDGDARTFPLTTLQAIRRFNKSKQSVTPWTGASSIASGALLTQVALNERYQTPYKIWYDAPNGTPTGSYIPTANGNASAVLLRWNDTSSTVTTGLSVSTSIASYAQLETKTLSFFYPADESGEDIIKNLFVGKFATKFVKYDNLETTYATATKVFTYGDTFNIENGAVTKASGGNSGKYKFAKVAYSGSFAVLAQAANTRIDLNVNYLSSIRYNYVSTSTGRYQKTIVGNNSRLILAQDDVNIKYSEPANLAISNIGATFAVANATRSTVYSLKNETRLSSPSTWTAGKVVLSTDSNGILTSLDIISFGSGHVKNDVLAIYNGNTKISGNFTFTVRNNYSNEDILEMFENGEFKVVLPKNCFILNSIQNPNSLINLKSELLRAKTIFKPGGYILYNGIYYKIATSNSTNNSPYIGVYRYINEDNDSDVRADIIVMLEDSEYVITYPSNTRFDVFDYDNVLDYWPTSGRITIGNRETCDFEKAGQSSDPKGYEIRLTRSMTKYWPHYIHDWEGLDPLNVSDSTVAVDTLIPTVITIADPVDVTCYGIKRFNSSGSIGDNIKDVDYGTTYVTPTGIITDKVARISINSTNDSIGLNADFEKLSIGQTITIPYRDISKSDTVSNQANATNWNNVKLIVGDPQNLPGTALSTNREGDRRISGSIAYYNSGSKQIYYKHTFNIHGSNTNDTSIYQYVSPLTSAILSSGRDSSVEEFNTAGFRRWGYLGVKSHANADAGQAAIQISSAYIQSMMRISSYATFTATFATINNTTDPLERIMTVTTPTEGALFRGQPLYTSGNHSNGTYSGLFGYVVGMAGDVFLSYDASGNSIYTDEDSLNLSGYGGAGTYRILLVDGASVPSNGSTIYGQRTSMDWLYYAPNNCCWQRQVLYKTVDSSNVTTVYFNNNLTDPDLLDNSILSVPASSDVVFYYYGYYDNSFVVTLDKPLTKSIVEGTEFRIAPTPDYDFNPTYGHPGRGQNNSFLFKSRILDLEKDGTNGKINVYLTDPLPKANWQRDSSGIRLTDTSSTSSAVKTFGMMYVNHGGWTYPKTGGSAFRVNNIKLASADANSPFSSKIYLPNRSGRVRAGDRLSYTWEDIYKIQAPAETDLGRITTTSTTSKVITLVAPASVADNRIYVQQVILPGYIIYTSANVEIGTVASVTATEITLVENAKVIITNDVGWKYTTTGKTFTYESQITAVGTLQTTGEYSGYTECTISANAYHILHKGYGTAVSSARENMKANWYSIQDVFVSHRLGNFTNDGPIARKFIYSDTGVKLTFGEYSIWYENYRNYIQPVENSTGQAMTGRQGWVGNFGLSSSGQRVAGISLNGTSSLQRGRQYQSSIWLSAVPVHAKWENSGSYAPYMMQSDNASTIELNYAPSTLSNYDGAGNFAFSALNHTHLPAGSIYASNNTGDYGSLGGESYDTKQYQFISNNTKLKYSLQNGAVGVTGSVSGGESSRLAENFLVNRVIHYKPVISNTFATQPQTTSVTTNASGNLSGTGIGNILLPGDVVYSTSTPSAADFVGIVRAKVDSDNVTLFAPPAVALSGDTSWSYISPRVMHATTAGAAVPAGQALVFTGDSLSSVTLASVGSAGYNVIGNTKPGYNRYNMRFNIDRRVYNQSTLVNTYTSLLSVESYEVANRVIDIKFGDLATYISPLMNVEVTRFNPKTHVESSISVVGTNLHI